MRVIIVGGGPAGMMAAIAASKTNNKVTLIEKNEKLGKKLFITGKGRCNVTNDCDKNDFFNNVVRNSKFINSSFAKFSNIDLQKLLNENGCPLKIERGNRVFPISDKAYDVSDCFKRILNINKVEVRLNNELIDVKEENNKIISIIVQNKNIKEEIKADKLIIATGGLAYPSTGSTGDGYKIAKKYGINVINQTPSLVPLNVKELDECKKMQGLTLKNVSIKIFKEKKIVYTDFGEMVFENYGVGGPIVLSSSCFMDDMPYELLIDLKPALEEKQLDLRLLREFEENKNGNIKLVLEHLLPKMMIDVFLERLNVENIKVADVNKELRKKIINLLKNFKFTILSKRGFEEAIITRGGIDVNEINPKTMESKKIKGLYFAGEVIDVDCLTGGFNIQVACTTGYAAGSEL